ncbi:MAG: hypothetical protein M1834_002451 [Cirrosporium novae-zelandiae]|nr:MAG: hypothetical protein M1834_002451 [Cirrosporium novae-zelandiae]
MAFTPAFPNAVSKRPRSQFAGKARGGQLLRDHFETGTWVLFGAALQSILTLLPITRKYAVVVVFFILGVKMLNQLLMVVGLKRNTYMDGVLDGKWAPVIPSEEDGGFGGDQEDVSPCGECIPDPLFHHDESPLGILAPGAKELNDYSESMYRELDNRAEYFGFLGASTNINTSDRSTLSEMVVILYFRSLEYLAKFANEEAHREGWNWWNKVSAAGKVNHIGISHEVYSVPNGNWEGIYINFKPTGLGATSHLVKDKDGEKKWTSPLVDARRGRLRTENGRMGLSMGHDYEKYNNDPYAKA